MTELEIAIVLEVLYWTKYNPFRLSRGDTADYTNILKDLTKILYSSPGN